MNTTKYSIDLRALEPGDIDLLMKWENDRSLWHLSSTLAPYSRYILEKYIETSAQDIYQTKQLRLMIDLVFEGGNVECVGCIDLFDFDPYHLRAGVGILIADASNRGAGYGKSALTKMIEYAFDYLHLHQLYCNISVSNEVSLALFEKAGFARAGLKKEWNRRNTGFEDEWFLQLISKQAGNP